MSATDGQCLQNIILFSHSLIGTNIIHYDYPMRTFLTFIFYLFVIIIYLSQQSQHLVIQFVKTIVV